MTKKDYILLTRILRNCKIMRYNGELISKDIIRDIVTNFEYALHAHDPKFKLDKFRKAILDD